MAKTITIKPMWSGIGGTDSKRMIMSVVPVNAASGAVSGAPFQLFLLLDGSAVLAQDNVTIIESPVPAGIYNASPAQGAAPWQTAIDAWDAAGKLDAYY